jgi:hypothetical protein
MPLETTCNYNEYTGRVLQNGNNHNKQSGKLQSAPVIFLILRGTLPGFVAEVKICH